MRAWEEHVVKTGLVVALAVLAFLAALVLGLLAWPGLAYAEGKVSFGIRPTRAHQDIPESQSYFIHTLAPGASTSDLALVMNNGDAPITLKLYAADAATAINGGTAFAAEGAETNGVGRWLGLWMKELSLQPGEERAVPFAISVPTDASPGQHVAGLVVEAVTSNADAGNGSTQTRLTVNVVRRAGVAVLIEVPGPRMAWLQITGLCLRQQDGDHGATFEFAVRNTGNVYLQGQGSLVIGASDGLKLASIPIEMDTVLAGDATHFQVTYPVLLPDGSYQLSATLDYAQDKKAVLEGKQVKVKNGQPEVGCAPPEAESPAAEPQETPVVLGAALAPTVRDGGGPPIGRYAIYAACSAVLIAAAAAAILVRRTRARRLREHAQRDSAVSEEAKMKPKHGQPRVGYRPAGRYGVYAASLAALAVAAPAIVLVSRLGTRRSRRR
jgi:hypothetical protein